MKPWYERKMIVTKSDYFKATAKTWELEFDRIEGKDIPTGCRASNRETGKMVAGWDKERDGAYTYWIVTPD